MSRAEPPPWSVPVAIHDVPETGRSFELAADENARKAVAKAIGVRALPHLEAGFDVTRHGREGLRVVGQVSARVEQACVVTLEPVENEVQEQVDLTFAPQPPAPVIDEAEARRRVAADDAPEPLVGGVVDLGVVATEFLLLRIDPYPRKSGAVFEASPTVGDGGGSPFAALAALKKVPDGHDR
jgi:uncharacterized metal-binding protein YceD (DUF177 family)